MPVAELKLTLDRVKCIDSDHRDRCYIGSLPRAESASEILPPLQCLQCSHMNMTITCFTIEGFFKGDNTDWR